jgi:hypothetical protein
MKPQPRRQLDDSEDRDEQEEEVLEARVPDIPQTGYRIAGDLEVRVAELRQEAGEQKAKIKQLERELWAARRAVRNQRKLTALANGGLGALIGILLGAASYAVWAAMIPVVVAPLLGFIVGLRWRLPDHDDNFPDAPPPRFQ